MFIKSINIKNIYSFGNNGTGDFNNLTKINLIIGKNGSGKSNVVRILTELSIGDINLGEFINNTVIPSKDPKKIFKGILEEINYWQYDNQFLEIQLDIGTISTKPLNQTTPFTKNRSGNASVFCYNSYELFENLRKSIFYYKGGCNKIFDTNLGDYIKEWLQFGIYYILGKEITINSESLDEYKIKSVANNATRGGHSLKKNNIPDSYFAIINILKSILINNKSILFIEEPENHIEPRALKRLINFIIYFFIDQNCVNSPMRKELEESKNNYNKASIHALNYHDFGSVIVQRPTYLSRKDRSYHIELPLNRYNQIFIISHSPILIDYISSFNCHNKRVSSTYEVYEDDVENDKSTCEVEINFNNTSKLCTTVSKIREIKDNVAQQELIESLGVKSSDLILSNGIIWVEGPSDSIYIKKFINIYIRDNNLMELEYGRHYLFAMYGGTLLNNYLIYGKSEDQDDLKKIISFVNFNKNFYIIIDSDAVSGSDIENSFKDRSKFKKAKDYVLEEFRKSAENGNIGLWYDKNNTKYTTIEDYIELKELKAFMHVKSKVNNSIKIINYLDNHSDITLLDIGKELNKKIEDIYDKIRLWNS